MFFLKRLQPCSCKKTKTKNKKKKFVYFPHEPRWKEGMDIVPTIYFEKNLTTFQLRISIYYNLALNVLFSHLIWINHP